MATGDTLQIDGTGHQAFLPAAGGVQTISLLGPVHVAFDTVVGAGVFGDGGLYHDLVALPDGCLLFMAWAEATVGWSQANSTIYFAVGVPGDPTGNLASDIHYGSIVQSLDSPDPTHFAIAGSPHLFVASGIASTIQPVRAIDGVTLQAYFSSSTPPAIQGEADIYALIATPRLDE